MKKRSDGVAERSVIVHDENVSSAGRKACHLEAPMKILVRPEETRDESE